MVIGGGGSFNFFDGSLDDLAVFSRALSATDVSHLYAGYRFLALTRHTT